MEKAWKVILIILSVIMAGSVIAGIVDMMEQKKEERSAYAQGRKIHKPYGPYEKYFKRVLDFGLSLLALIVLSPVMAVMAVLIKVKLGGPVIFAQERPGRKDSKTGKEKIFRLYKFRTMTEEKDENGELLPDGMRLTRFGKILRAASLDEIPEFFNIAEGNLSLVGPRPLLDRYLPYYTEGERHRHDVRPGLTGASQISGRNFLCWEERFEQDVNYVNHITFIEDLRIIICTFIKVFRKEDVMQADTDKKKMGFDDLDKERMNLKGWR